MMNAAASHVKLVKSTAARGRSVQAHILPPPLDILVFATQGEGKMIKHGLFDHWRVHENSALRESIRSINQITSD